VTITAAAHGGCGSVALAQVGRSMLPSDSRATHHLEASITGVAELCMVRGGDQADVAPRLARLRCRPGITSRRISLGPAFWGCRAEPRQKPCRAQPNLPIGTSLALARVWAGRGEGDAVRELRQAITGRSSSGRR